MNRCTKKNRTINHKQRQKRSTHTHTHTHTFSRLRMKEAKNAGFTACLLTDKRKGNEQHGVTKNKQHSFMPEAARATDTSDKHKQRFLVHCWKRSPGQDQQVSFHHKPSRSGTRLLPNTSSILRTKTLKASFPQQKCAWHDRRRVPESLISTTRAAAENTT